MDGWLYRKELTLFKKVPFCFCLTEVFFFDEIFLAHALDGVVFLIFFVLAEHDFAKGAPAEHFEEFKLFEIVDVIFVGFAFEDDFAFCFNLIALFDAFCVEHEGFDGV